MTDSDKSNIKSSPFNQFQHRTNTTKKRFTYLYFVDWRAIRFITSKLFIPLMPILNKLETNENENRMDHPSRMIIIACKQFAVAKSMRSKSVRRYRHHGGGGGGMGRQDVNPKSGETGGQRCRRPPLHARNRCRNLRRVFYQRGIDGAPTGVARNVACVSAPGWIKYNGKREDEGRASFAARDLSRTKMIIKF